MNWPFFKKKKEYKTLSIPELRNRLLLDFKNHLANKDNIFIADKRYALIPDEEVWAALRNQQRFYIPEKGDCDDYARKVVNEMKDRALSGKYNDDQPAVGFFWTPTHAWIVWVNEHNTVMIADSPDNVKVFNHFIFKETIRFILI